MTDYSRLSITLTVHECSSREDEAAFENYLRDSFTMFDNIDVSVEFGDREAAACPDCGSTHIETEFPIGQGEKPGQQCQDCGCRFARPEEMP